MCINTWQYQRAALHGCIGLILACPTEKKTRVRRCFAGIQLRFLGKLSTKCQHFTGLVRCTVFLHESEKQHETNKMPTTTQQISTFCQHGGFAAIPSREAVYFLVGCPKMCPLQWLATRCKTQNTALYQINMDVPNRTENIRW